MRAIPTEMPLPVATVFSFGNDGKGALSGIHPADGPRVGTTDEFEEEWERIRPGWSEGAASMLASSGERMISEIGRCRRARAIEQSCGGGGGGAGEWRIPRRRKRFALSRGPASFLKIDPRLASPACLGNCSVAKSVSMARPEKRWNLGNRLESRGAGSDASSG